MSLSEKDDSGAEVVTLVMDAGTAYVLLQQIGMTIDLFRRGQAVGAPAEVLIHAHDQLAGQLGMDAYDDRKAPFVA